LHPSPDKPDQNQKLKASLAEHAEDAEFKTKTRKSFMANYFLIFSASSAPLREIFLPFCKEFEDLLTFLWVAKENKYESQAHLMLLL